RLQHQQLSNFGSLKLMSYIINCTRKFMVYTIEYLQYTRFVAARSSGIPCPDTPRSRVTQSPRRDFFPQSVRRHTSRHSAAQAVCVSCVQDSECRVVQEGM